ncbi:MAG: hypothetical protein Q9P01_15415 [Anaerolineae bacterium]|nr:hypothetical protein [Anaerolineae bacterium]
MQLRWRWLKNLLSGRPEPKFPQFQIFVVSMIVDSSRRRVLSEFTKGQLPRVKLEGQYDIWEQLSDIFPLDDWQWVGVWQDVRSNTIEWVFLSVNEFLSNRWIAARDLNLERDKQYMEKVKPKHRQKVWFLEGEI